MDMEGEGERISDERRTKIIRRPKFEARTMGRIERNKSFGLGRNEEKEP